MKMKFDECKKEEILTLDPWRRWRVLAKHRDWPCTPRIQNTKILGELSPISESLTSMYSVSKVGKKHWQMISQLDGNEFSTASGRGREHTKREFRHPHRWGF
jgi:hypothetical protein